MNLSALRLQLIENPSRDSLIEIVNAAELPNPAMKSLVFLAVNTAPEKDIIRFSRLAAVAIQYIELKDRDGLEKLIRGQNIPEPILQVVLNYVGHIA